MRLLKIEEKIEPYDKWLFNYVLQQKTISKSGETFGKNEMERLWKVVDVTREDMNFIKEVGPARDQFRFVATIRCFQDVRRRQSSNRAVHCVNLQHIAEHDTVQRYTFHGPDHH